MSQSGQPQHFRMDGQGTQSGEKGYGKGFQAGGPTGPYPVGEVGPGSPQPASPTHQEQPSMPGSPGPQGPLFTPDQLTQIAQIFRMGIEPVVREMSTRLDSLQAQVTRVPEGTAALHGARPADASLSSGLSSGPSRFGEQPPTSPGPAFRPVGSPPGIAQVTPQRGERNPNQDDDRDGRDIFSKSEKWLPPMPTVDFRNWKTRADEVLGFSDWVQALRAWVSLGSDIFAWEIAQCIGWEQEIHMSVLKPAQQTRSARLLAILIQTFKDFPRGNTMLQAYVEGVGVDGAFLATRGTSGFEGLRLLAREFSLRSRAEASFFRTEFLAKTFKASAGVTQVSDIIRQIDVGLSRFRKMIETLPATVSRVGLEVQTSDLTIMLLRSLPHDVRSYTTLHAAGDAYTDLRTAALRFETQQRMFAELSGPSSSGARGVHALESAETAEEWWGYDQEGYDNSEYAQEEDPDDQWEWDEDAQVWISATVAKGKGSPKSTMKCHLCGRRGHMAKECKADLSKVKCFHCSKFGHIGAQCPDKPKGDKGKQQKKPQPKAGKSKGKGKMHELAEENGQEAAPAQGEVLMPLISSVEHSGDEWRWWLIDSGAAVSVLFKAYYKCSAEEQVMDTYYAANGSAVTMRGEVQVTVVFETGSGSKKSQNFRLKCCVGSTSHNIVSTTQLVKRGWTVVQSPGETYLWHEESNTVITDVVLWGGCPWLRAKKTTSQVPALKDTYMPMEVDVPMESVRTGQGLTVGMVGAVELSTQERLRQHILRGHYPYDPHCLECQQGRGVSRAPRRDLKERLLEVQVDFMFLGTVGSQYKFLLFRHCFSGLLGVCAVSESLDTTGQHVRQILAEFGLLSGDPKPIDFRSDASDELGTTLRRAGIPREFTVSKAGPQNHDTVGSVERGVRELKEGLAVLRLELGKAGVDVVNSLVGWEASSRYVIAMHNLHSKLDGTGLSGREVLRNQVDQKNAVTAMFCSRVLAETPDSVNSIGRFVTAGYLYPVRNSFAHFVVALIEGELKFFQAKSLKLVFPIVYPLELVGRFLRAVDSAGPAPAILDQEPIEIVPEDFARLPDKVQPPRHWIDAHGRTEGCSSCATRQGRHSKKCCERYWTWLRNQRSKEAVVPEKQLPLAEPNDQEVAVPVPSQPLPKIPGLPSGMLPTRHCPSCESGMNAPGTRHSAECRKRQGEFLSTPIKPSLEDVEQALEQAGEGGDVPYSPSLGPEHADLADVDMDLPLEASSAPAEAASFSERDAPEFQSEDVEMEVEQPQTIPMIDVCLCSERVRIGCLTSPDLLSEERFSVESISFSGGAHDSEVVELCGSKVRLWKPTGAVSDTTLEELDPQGTFLAMVKELKGLTHVNAGRVMKEKEALQFCKKHNIKVISCRWVTNSKPEADEGVRARIVVKDFAKGQKTARQEGISSPTPSIESLRLLLGAATGMWTGGKGFNLYAIDVSQAFMNSPLTVKVCVRLPSSISTLDNEPVFLEAYKGLNGLRIASLTWVLFFDGIVKSVGIRSGLVEPCLYGGMVRGAPILVICYVDDLLVATPSEAAYRVLFEALEKQVKIRETGRVTMSGGSLKFLGRTILREKGSSGLQLFVDQDYLNSAFEEYGISKGSTAFPDLRPFLEQTLQEEPISAEAHSKFRRVLGRLSWLAQTQQDILILIAMLSTGQSCPKPGHEKALRAVLRFMLLHMKMSQKFPSPGLEDLSEKDIGLEVYSDAGFAPMQATQRRSITGCVIVFRCVVLKCFSRHQASVTLSSCEAELVAVQAAVQEAIGLLRSLSFVLRRVQVNPPSLSEDDSLDFVCPILLWTDSLSGKMLLEGSDLQRRSRHIDIKVNWLRELLGKEILQIGHVRGTGNVADHFTKCLPTIKALQYMEILGFSSFEGILLDCLLDFEIRDNSFSGLLCAFSTRNCMFCGELICEEPANSTTCELSPFPRSCTHMINALVAVCERFQGEGIGSAMAGRIPAEREEPRAPDSHALLGHPTAEGVGAAPESDDTVTIIGGEANTATVAVTSAEAVVPAAEAVPKAAEAAAPPAATEAAPGAPVASETAAAEAEDVVEVTPKKAQPPRPKEKAMPTTRGRPEAKARPSGRSQAPGREPAVKKMPRKPGRFVIQVKKEAWEATGLLKRRREAGRRKAKRQAWKNRQKEAFAYFAAQRREEESRPTPTYEVVRGSRLPGQRRVMRRMYNPQLNKREELEINPKAEEEKGPAFVRSFSGFSWKNPKGLKCGHCGEKGHIISQCPEMERRVSLTHGRVTLTPRGQHQPDSTVGDEVAPGDSISQVGLTQESLRIHNKRLRGHGWSEEAPAAAGSPPRARQRTGMGPPQTPPKRSGQFPASSNAAVAMGPKPPPHPPKGWVPQGPQPPQAPPISGKAPPAMPSPAQGPLPPPPAPPAPPQVPPPPPAPRRVSSAPKTPPKTPPKAKSGEPTSPKASPGAKAAPTVDLVTPKSPEAKAASLVGEPPHRPFRVGPGGALEAETIAPSSGYSMSMISRTPVAKAPASEAPPEPSETSGRPPQRRMEACIACHGSGELPM